MPPVLKIGYIHFGRTTGGISIYGQALARGLREQGVSTEEWKIERHQDLWNLWRALRALRGSDIIHLQYCGTWTGRLTAVLTCLMLKSHSDRICLTLHDVYPELPVKGLFRFPSILHLLPWASERIVVNHQEEARRFQVVVPQYQCTVIPHFVTEHKVPLSPEQARQHLGLSDRIVLTLLGTIIKRKGHEVLLQALPHLPENFFVVFAGGPVHVLRDQHDAILEMIRRNGLENRVRVTGYLEESQMRLYMQATDLAVCPFLDLSASGTLSLWLGARKPILVTRLPQIDEYNALSPGAIATVDPLTPETLARRILELLPSLRQENEKVGRLADLLSLPNYISRYHALYREMLKKPGQRWWRKTES